MKLTNYSDVRKVIKKRSLHSHKGENGTVLVIGGSEHYVSAPALSALAALRTGIDLIQVAGPEKAAYAINSFSIDFITKKMKGTFMDESHSEELLAFASDFDCVLIGPGLGKRDSTKKFVNKFIKENKIPIVIDADAIQQLNKENIKGLLCPHEREFEIVFGEKPSHDLNERIHLTKKYAKEFNCTVLLKGHFDVVSDGVNVKVNKTGNPGMTVGGTGDILSGIASGFVAQKNSFFDSAAAAAFVNGKIGDKLYNEMGYGFVASDFIPLIPKIIYGKK